MSFKMEVNKDVGSLASLDKCYDAEIDPSLPMSISILEPWKLVINTSAKKFKKN